MRNLFSVVTTYFSDNEYVISYNIYCDNGKVYYFDDFIHSKDLSIVLCAFMMQFRNIDTISDLMDITIKVKSPTKILQELRHKSMCYGSIPKTFRDRYRR